MCTCTEYSFAKLDGRLRVEPEDEPVGVRVDDLLGEAEVRQVLDGAEQRDVAALAQLEGGAGANVAVQRALAHQGPVLDGADLEVVLEK